MNIDVRNVKLPARLQTRDFFMQLVVDTNGSVRCIYGEEIPLQAIGQVAVTRASHVEPDPDGCWFADLSPVAGPQLGPYERRSQALTAELRWLETNWLGHTLPEP
jgi:hypothetical protein